MKVHLVTHTEEPDKICAMAAYVSISKEPLSEFSKKWTDADTEKWIRIAIAKGHTSVLEHASFTFSIEGVSRACTHQLVRHRIASYTQQSLRRASGGDTKIPISIRRSALFERVNKLLNEIHDTYNLLVEQKIPMEDARFILPIGTKTNIVVTMNCRELYESFFPLRCCTRAQWEIREVAWKMLRICKQKAPLIFKDAGPRCKRLGYCPERRD